ncbi:MAG: sensor histidine kinase [Acidimicrobiales bacterium]
MLVRIGDDLVVEAAVGPAPGPASPSLEAADVVEPIGADRLLVLRGGEQAADDRRVLKAFTAQLAAAIERKRLGAQAARASALADADELRTAMLQAVSHDLRTPLASIKAAVSTLRQDDVDLGAEDRKELLEAVESETDRLTELVTNLLDLTKLGAGPWPPSSVRCRWRRSCPPRS